MHPQRYRARWIFLVAFITVVGLVAWGRQPSKRVNCEGWTLTDLERHVRTAHPDLHVIYERDGPETGFWISRDKRERKEMFRQRRITDQVYAWDGAVFAQYRHSEDANPDLLQEVTLWIGDIHLFGDPAVLKEIGPSLPQ